MARLFSPNQANTAFCLFIVTFTRYNCTKMASSGFQNAFGALGLANNHLSEQGLRDKKLKAQATLHKTIVWLDRELKGNAIGVLCFGSCLFVLS